MSSENKKLLKAGIASAVIHCSIVVFGYLNVFEPKTNHDMFLNIEIAGASELQQALDDFNNHPIIEEQQPQEITPPEEIQQKETLSVEDPVPEPEIKQEITPEAQPEPQQEEIPTEQLVNGPSIVEPEPEITQDPEPELEAETEELSQESEDALPLELQNKEKLEQEKLEKEKLEKEKKLQKEKEKKRRLEKKKREEKIKKKKEAARRRKKRLEAIKRIEKKKKEKRNRLAKIANAIQKNNERKKQKENAAFTQMIKSEKTKIIRKNRSYGNQAKGFGNGNGLGSYGDGRGFVDSDAAIVSNQIIPHWVVAGGVKNAETLIIRIRIKVKDNGEVPANSIEILDKKRYNSDRVFKSAADSAKRAILKASPLKIPKEKMHLFRDFELSFNTDKALGV